MPYVADSTLPAPVVGVSVMVMKTKVPLRQTGLLSWTSTGYVAKVPSAQLGRQLLTLCMAVPVALVNVQLVQVMDPRLS